METDDIEVVIEWADEPKGLPETAKDARRQLAAIKAELAELRKERGNCKGIFRWLLGEGPAGGTAPMDWFQPRGDDDPPYWWRVKLRELVEPILLT